MPELEETGDALATCESNFERDMMRRLLERSYRVQSQVGSLGFRIDMVVEGADRTRLAVECDGDRFHGPEQWRQDMRRQRVLERVGWRFWRCFASSFYRDPDAVMADLVETLTRMGIEPLGKGEGRPQRRFTEHRIVEPPAAAAERPGLTELSGIDLGPVHAATAGAASAPGTGIAIGDKVVLLFSDDQKRISARLTEGSNDLEKGRLSVTSPLGQAILGAEEGDEVELPLENGRQRKALIESIEKSPAPVSVAPTVGAPTESAAAVA
jgi:very-short-patch-repair endonuclease